MELELHVADVVDDHKIKMDAMRLKNRKIRKYAKMTTQSSLPHWNCCNGRQTMVYLTRDLERY